MRAGDLKDVIRVDRCKKLTNACGEEVEEWLFYKFYRADVLQRLGNVATEANVIRANEVMEFRCRWYVNIRIGDRVTFNGDKYRIVGRSRDRKTMMVTFSGELEL